MICWLFGVCIYIVHAVIVLLFLFLENFLSVVYLSFLLYSVGVVTLLTVTRGEEGQEEFTFVSLFIFIALLMREHAILFEPIKKRFSEDISPEFFRNIIDVEPAYNVEISEGFSRLLPEQSKLLSCTINLHYNSCLSLATIRLLHLIPSSRHNCNERE